MTIVTPRAPLARSLVFALLIALSVQLPAQSPANPPRSDGKVQMASLRPALVWQRTSPKPGSAAEGPVLYQLLFSTAGTPGTLAKFDTNPRHLTNSLITDNGTIVAISGMSVNGSTGIISFAPGQTFQASGSTTVTSLSAGAGIALSPSPITSTGSISITNGGVTNAMMQNPALTVNTGTGLSGGGAVALGGTLMLNNTGLLSVGASAPLAVSAGQTPTLSLSTVDIAHGGTASPQLRPVRASSCAARGRARGASAAFRAPICLRSPAPMWI